jgi:hypothetical protein
LSLCACAEAPAPERAANPVWRLEFRDGNGTEWKDEGTLARDGVSLYMNTDDDNRDGLRDDSSPAPVFGEDDHAALRLLDLPEGATVAFDLPVAPPATPNVRLFARPDRQLPITPGAWVDPRDMHREGGWPTVFVEGTRAWEALLDTTIEIKVRAAGAESSPSASASEALARRHRSGARCVSVARPERAKRFARSSPAVGASGHGRGSPPMGCPGVTGDR